MGRNPPYFFRVISTFDPFTLEFIADFEKWVGAVVTTNPMGQEKVRLGSKTMEK